MPLPSSSGPGINFTLTSVGWERDKKRDMQEYVCSRRILKHLTLEKFRRVLREDCSGLEDWVYGETRAHFINSLLNTCYMPGMGL